MYTIVLTVIVCMPPLIPVTTSSMNYISVIVVGLLGITTLLWFTTGRKNFEGPHIDWEFLKDANMQSLREKEAVVAI